MKKAIFLVLLISTFIGVYAQNESEDTEPIPKVRSMDSYIGVQANYLVREFFNFGGSNSLAGLNPFGFVYHLNSKNSGAGFRLGLGPSIYNVTNVDGLATIKSKGYVFDGRIGFDKRFSLNTSWEAGFGLDAVIRVTKDETKNDQQDFQGFTTQTSSTTSSYGGGPMCYIRYKLKPNVLLGTETSFYYLSGKSKNKATTIDQFGQVVLENSDEDSFGNGQLVLPVSIYIFVKF